MAFPNTPAFAAYPAFLPRSLRHAVCNRRTTPARHPVRRMPLLNAAPTSPTPPSIKVGDIVAAQLGSTTVTVARVTGVASSGDTVDISPLEEFVRELYVPGKEASTYARADAVRAIRAEYVPNQEGWIVLNQDLEVAKKHFATLAAAGKAERVVVAPETPRELSPEALEKQLFPKPTRGQALFGAALSLPVAALCYSAFAGARDSYKANPLGYDFHSGEAFRNVVLFSTYAGAVMSVFLGCYLLFYAVMNKDE